MESGFAVSPGDSAAGAGLAVRPNLVHPLRKVGKLSEWFDTSAFALPTYGFYGDASNGIIRGPSEFTGNAALYETFPIREKVDLQFRAEAFNVANHPNWDAVVLTV